jgi:hypothetical protein
MHLSGHSWTATFGALIIRCSPALLATGRPNRLLKNKAPRSMTLAAQCDASSFSVPCGAATVMERGSIEFFNMLLKELQIIAYACGQRSFRFVGRTYFRPRFQVHIPLAETGQNVGTVTFRARSMTSPQDSIPMECVGLSLCALGLTLLALTIAARLVRGRA